MDLEDQLRKLFPDHEPENGSAETDGQNEKAAVSAQSAPIECHFERRKGKVVTVIKGIEGGPAALKALASELKKLLNVGGGVTDDRIVVQGDYRDRIMDYLGAKGFSVKRVGG